MKRAVAASAAAVLAGTAAADTTPGQFRLALAGGGGMRVSWSTPDAAPTQCSYGTTPSLGQTANGTSTSYGWSWHHHVLLPALTPSTQFYYACGGAATPTAFMSPPAPGSRAPFGVAVFGDWGWLDSVQRPTLPVGGLQANWSATLTRQLLEGLKNKGAYQMVYHVGDIAYEDDGFGHPDGLLNFTYEHDYDGWFDWIENVSSVYPYMVATGNHESECHSPYCILNLNSTGLKLNNFTAYNARWAMPGADSGGVLAMWHSWDYANAHFVALDTSTDFPGAPEGTTGDGGFPFLPAGSFGAPGQYMAWLEADLAAAAAARAAGKIDWIITGAHRPFEDFPSADVIALFAKYGVDVFFAGHAHSYSRFNVSAWGDGTLHITVGGAGCDEMPWPADQLAPVARPLPEDVGTAVAACRAWCARPEVLAGYAAVPGGKPASDPCGHCGGAPGVGASPVVFSDLMAAGLLTINGTSLTWQLLRAPDGALLDTITLTK